MKVFVIGGTHFIGPPVVRYLMEAEHEVMVFHRGQTQADLPSDVRHLLGNRHDLRQYRAQIEQFGPDVVLDMIPYTQADAATVIETVRGVCDRIVAISSQDVYRARDIIWGLETEGIDPTPLTEEAPLRSHLYPYQNAGTHPLGVPADYEKILVEKTYLDSPDFSTTVLRLPMVYGPGDPLHRFYAALQRMEQERPYISLVTDLAHWRSSYGYVENVAWAIALAVQATEAGNAIYNVSEPDAMSELERLTLLGNLMGWLGSIRVVERSELPESWRFPFNLKQDWVTDSTRIRQALDYREPVSLSEALSRTLTWELAHPPADITQSAGAGFLLDDAIEAALNQAYSNEQEME